MAKNRSHFDVVQPGPSMDKLKSTTTARKSSLPTRADGGPEGDVLSFEMDPQTLAIRKKKERLVRRTMTFLRPYLASQLKKSLQFEILPSFRVLPQVTWRYHAECSSICLGGFERDPADPQFYNCSPLHIPILCGWKRMVRYQLLPCRAPLLLSSFSYTCMIVPRERSAMAGFCIELHVDVLWRRKKP
ncbi:unnamed protein product [Cylicostephanus goldi]|uniref:Uncharacterized protein n=1 Tax=Cylicostephanus goldi TaxID=71465 RepID=A0A3P6S7Y6_CYLGO|nr:unnamed protein product [Cylicostephanus goldi]